MKGTLFIISSPSGAGKTSLLTELFKKHNNDNSMYLSISHTTRQIRPGETNGVSYHFVSEDEFKRLIARDAFYEWAHVFDKYYGTSKELVQQALSKGQDVFLDIDWQGARQMRKLEPSAKSIFILPPSLKELENRLIARGQDSSDVIKSRMQKAQREISHYNEYDFIIINDKFETSSEALWSIVNAYRQKRAYQASKNEVVLANLLEGYSYSEKDDN